MENGHGVRGLEIVIITSVHDKGGFAQKDSESNCIKGSKVLLFGGIDLGEEADRMGVAS